MVKLLEELARQLEIVKREGEEILAKRKAYLNDQETHQPIDDSAAFITNADLVILDSQGSALEKLQQQEKKLIGLPFERFAYHLDRREIYEARDRAELAGENTLMTGIGLQIGTKRIYTHYELSGRAIRERNNKDVIGFSLLIKRATSDINPEHSSQRFPSLNRASNHLKEEELIAEIKRIRSLASESANYTIDLSMIPNPSENLFGEVGMAFGNNQYIRLLGVRSLEPFYYTAIRDLAYKSGRTCKKDLGLRMLSMVNPFEKK